MIRRLMLSIAALVCCPVPAPAQTQKPLVIMNGQTRQLPASTTLATQPATAGSASLNIPAGTIPAAPVDGDCWTTTLQLSCQIGGNTFGTTSSNFGNPTIAGGLFGISDTISLTNQLDTYTLSGSRTKALIGRSIIVNDNASAPASGPATASYGLSVYAQRPNWITSAITGEMDPINIVVRQANGDSAGILSNILTRNGFGATLESYTGSADPTGAPVKAVNVQLGVSNSRDGTNYGMVIQSVLGANLNAGIRIAQISGSNFSNAIELTSGANLLAYVRGADGAFIGGSVVPIANLGANIGDPSLRYANTFTRNLSLGLQVYASLSPCNASNVGLVSYIGDAPSQALQSGQPVSGGGGSSPAMLACDGTTWVAAASMGSSSPPGCVNILYYGADRTGVNASDAAWTAAVAASKPGRQCIYAPFGSYTFATAKTFNISASYPQGSVTIRGDGAEVTSFNFASGTSGLAFTLNTAFQSFHVRDLSVLGGSYAAGSVGIGALQSASVNNPAYTALSDITNVTVRGNDGYAQINGFGVGINLDQVSNVNLTGGYISGSNPTVATCIRLNSATSNVGVVYNVSGMTMNACSIGIYYGSNIQGVSISQSNFTGDTYGIVVPAGVTGGAQLSVTGSQFNTYGTSIQLLTDPGGVSIVNNVFYVNGATGGANGIQTAATQDELIVGNAFIGLGSNVNGLNIGAYNRFHVLVSNNSFVSLTSGILLASGSQNVTVGTNVYSNVSSAVVNSGTNNAVAVTCSAPPTSGFRVTNGVITGC